MLQTIIFRVIAGIATILIAGVAYASNSPMRPNLAVKSYTGQVPPLPLYSSTLPLLGQLPWRNATGVRGMHVQTAAPSTSIAAIRGFQNGELAAELVVMTSDRPSRPWRKEIAQLHPISSPPVTATCGKVASTRYGPAEQGSLRYGYYVIHQLENHTTFIFWKASEQEFKNFEGWLQELSKQQLVRGYAAAHRFQTRVMQPHAWLKRHNFKAEC